MYTIDQIKKIFKDKGYVFNENGNYNLNIFGVRTTNGKLDLFDDWLYVVYKDDQSKWVIKCYPCTTESGLYYLLKPLNPLGTAIVVPGQYKGSHTIGLHQGKYEALVQCGLLAVYRDNNKDNKYDCDPTKIQKGSNFGINIHSTKPNLISKIVYNWSAACQVIQDWNNFQEFMQICRKSRDLYGNKFSYTLLESKDFQ